MRRHAGLTVVHGGFGRQHDESLAGLGTIGLHERLAQGGRGHALRDLQDVGQRMRIQHK